MAEKFLVQLKNADVALSGQKVLHGIDWLIEPDQHWRVDGENGAGKTTLLKTIAGLLWPVAKRSPSRLYGFNTQVSHLLAGVKNQIGYASYGMQDEYVRGARNINCHEVIASGFEQNIMVYDRLSDDQQQNLEKLVKRLGLSELLGRSFLSISHGQKSAVLFARALIHQPKLLVLDEIFNGVDPNRFALMVELLQEYKQKDGQIVLSWHEHGVEAVEKLFTYRLILAAGKVSHIEKNAYQQSNSNGVVNKINNSNHAHQPGKKLIGLKNVNVYLQNEHILKNINWTIHQGERWLLRGENGAGKTTLLKTLLAEVRPSVDSVIWRYGFNQRSSVWQIRKLIGYVSPELQQAYHYNVCVEDAVASGFFSSIGVYDNVNSQQSETVKHLLQEFDLLDLANSGVHQISSGQMRRVLIARAMTQNPDILILDEITANLDQHSRLTILQVIEELARAGKTMIFVGHYDDAIMALANRELTLSQGEIQYEEILEKLK